MVEKNPWWKNVSGPFPKWEGPTGCKEDGGGCHRGQGLVGTMAVHRAVNNHDKQGKDVHPPLHQLQSSCKNLASVTC